MTAYTIALFLHILGAMGIFTVVGFAYISLISMRRAQSAQVTRLWAQTAARVTQFVLPISGLLVLLAGFTMLAVSYKSTPGWTIMGFIGLVLIGAITPQVTARRFSGIAQSLRGLPGDATVPAETAAQVRAPAMWLTLNAVAGLLVGVVFLMTSKPDLLGSLITLLIATVLGLALGQLTAGRRTQARAQVARQS
ncbi:MAG TPA: hypothetical protein VF807_13860 [Ktedonobacterales bacterium]